jgi:hypothetical protein
MLSAAATMDGTEMRVRAVVYVLMQWFIVVVVACDAPPCAANGVCQ